jgi:excisionase family DNA binding protein
MPNPIPTPTRVLYTVRQFCAAHEISRATFYRLLKAGRGPRITKIGDAMRISVEAAKEWLAQTEQETERAELKPRGSAKKAPTLAEMLAGRA